MTDFDISQYNVTVSMEDIACEVPVGATDQPSDSVVEEVTDISWSQWLFSQVFSHLEETPNSIAVIEDVGEARCVTYSELIDDVRKTANYLTHHGIGQGDMIGICMDNCVEYIVYELAVFLIGGVPVLFNPGHVASDRISKLDITAIIVDSAHYGHVLRLFENWRGLQRIFILSEDITSIYVPTNVWIYDGFGYLDFPSDFNEPREPNNEVVVAFATSGISSSKGKIVGHSSSSTQILCTQYYHELFTLLSEKEAIDELRTQTHLITTGLHTIEGFSYLIFSLISGNTAVVTESNADVWRISFLDRIGGLIEQYQIALIMVHSQLLKCFVKYELHKLYNLDSVKILAHSGSAIPTVLVKELQKNLDVSITQAYITSEFGVLCFDEIQCSDEVIIGSGEPFLGMDVKIASLSDETEVEPNQCGRIMVQGPSIFSQYLSEDDKSENVITKNGWYRTDDYGKLDEQARLYVIEKLEGVLRIDSQEIALSSVENVLLEHEDVDDVAVAQLEDRICVGVVLRDGEVPPSSSELQEMLTEKGISLEVSTVTIVDFIPRSETGKIIRSEVPFLLKAEELFDGNESSI